MHTPVCPFSHLVHLYPSKRQQKRRAADEDDVIESTGLSTPADGEQATNGDGDTGDVDLFNGDFDVADEPIMPSPIAAHEPIDYEPIIVDESYRVLSNY